MDESYERHSSGSGEIYNFGLREMLAQSEEKPSEAKSIRRTALILACICNRINSLADISEHSRLSKSTVHRLLKGMEKSNLVIHDPISKRYYLGSLIRHLISQPQVTHEYLVNCAAREMERLATVTDETIVLSVKIGQNHIALHAIPSTHELRIVGTRRVGPLHVGAGGKVLLSQLGDAELRDTLKKIDVDPGTSKEDLLQEVERIRRQGYAITTSERVFGATFIAAPIVGYDTPAALSITGPDARMKPRISSFVDALLVAADNVSKNLASRTY